MQAGPTGLIGPNAILQMLPVLETQCGQVRTHALVAQAGLPTVPDGSAMIPETDAAHLHRAVRQLEPARACDILREAGERTADYILAHRIPRAAQIVLKCLPAPLAARLLAGAIAHHAWTFAGSGRFRVLTPWRFEIAHNPLIAGEHSDRPLCDWHAAVFEKLYRTLVAKNAVCVEETCGAQNGGHLCIFSLKRVQSPL